MAVHCRKMESPSNPLLNAVLCKKKFKKRLKPKVFTKKYNPEISWAGKFLAKNVPKDITKIMKLNKSDYEINQ